ncbi:hypothetical protein ABE501_18365 [Comamonas testosteroni]
MTGYDNTNRGVMFVNDRKQEGDRKPDRTGTLNVEGVEYFVDGWIKQSQNGNPFLSLSLKRKDKQPGGGHSTNRPAPAPAPAPRAPFGFNDMDSEDIPFIDPMRRSLGLYTVI